jgi:hypothetical protein
MTVTITKSATTVGSFSVPRRTVATSDHVWVPTSARANVDFAIWPTLGGEIWHARSNAEQLMDELRQMPPEQLRSIRAEFNSMPREEFLARRREQRVARARAAVNRFRSASD